MVGTCTGNLDLSTKRDVMISYQQPRFPINGDPLYLLEDTSVLSIFISVRDSCFIKITLEASLDKVRTHSYGILTGFGASMNDKQPNGTDSVYFLIGDYNLCGIHEGWLTPY